MSKPDTRCLRDAHADLGGAIAAPITFVLIADGRYTPGIDKFLVRSGALLHGVVAGWSAIAAAALTVTCLAMRELMAPLHTGPVTPVAARPRPPRRRYPAAGRPVGS